MLDLELGPFLRSRRESVTPSEVGLPEGPRRRTPGLRRAELATLAGISVDYLVRLEQGRDRNPSAQVLGAIADVLHLGPDDREHLRLLSCIGDGDLCPEFQPPASSVRPTVRAMLDLIEPAPALVLNRVSDLLAWTTGYERLGAPTGILAADRPNFARYTFLDERARVTYPDWERVADEQVAQLRVGMRYGEQASIELVAELTERAGVEFSRRWDARPVERKGTGAKRMVHPDVGELRLAYETLQLPDADDQRLVVYLAADAATSEALDRLNGRRPGALRGLPTRETAGSNGH